MAALHAQNERLRLENERLRMLLEDKGAQIAELEERVARPERLISRNSGNSSMPPSTDDLPGKKPPERKPRCGCGRKPGKQPGSPGAYLAWNDRPDKRVDMFPEGACSCGKGLARAADLVPVERCADIIESMSGIRPSDGWVHMLVERAARAVAAANKAIRALIILARVVCGDETPLRAGPGPKSRKKYLHVACTSLLTYYFLGDRDLASFKGFVYSDLHGAVVVHDRYQNYDSFPGISHQLCCQHLLRDLEAGSIPVARSAIR